VIMKIMIHTQGFCLGRPFGILPKKKIEMSKRTTSKSAQCPKVLWSNGRR
jgi:hypothetical protein